MSAQMCEAFLEAAEMAYRRGIRNLAATPGPWIGKVDEHWTIAVNPHAEPVEAAPEGAMSVSVPPYSMAVWWNGWLAGLLDAAGGTIAAGELANEETFIKAVKEAR